MHWVDSICQYLEYEKKFHYYLGLWLQGTWFYNHESIFSNIGSGEANTSRVNTKLNRYAMFISFVNSETFNWRWILATNVTCKLQSMLEIGNNKKSYNDLEVISEYRIFANSFRGNYSFLNLALCTVTFGYST